MYGNAYTRVCVTAFEWTVCVLCVCASVHVLVYVCIGPLCGWQPVWVCVCLRVRAYVFPIFIAILSVLLKPHNCMSAEVNQVFFRLKLQPDAWVLAIFHCFMHYNLCKVSRLLLLCGTDDASALYCTHISRFLVWSYIAKVLSVRHIRDVTASHGHCICTRIYDRCPAALVSSFSGNYQKNNNKYFKKKKHYVEGGNLRNLREGKPSIELNWQNSLQTGPWAWENGEKDFRRVPRG